MTKLLYIPNGSYVFYNAKNRTVDFTECNLEKIAGYRESPENELDDLLRFSDFMIDHPELTIYHDWIKVNNFQFPLLRDEFEIIYD